MNEKAKPQETLGTPASLPVPTLVQAIVHDITGWRLVLPILFMGSIASAIGVVYSKHISRDLTNQWQQAQVARDKLEVEWRNLRLEQSAMAEHSRVEEIARDKLRMVPVADDVQEVVQQPEQRMASK